MSSTANDTGGRDLLHLTSLIAAGLVAFAVFAYGAARTGTFDSFESDLIAHSLMTHGQFHGTWWTYSLWYPLLRLITIGGSADQLMINAGFLLLGSLATLRGIVVARLLVSSGFRHVPAIVATTALVSCLALPTLGLNEDYYLGTLAPNSLASATQLVAVLFAIPAVYFLSMWFVEPTSANLVWVGVTGGLATLAKAGLAPSWLAGFCVVTLVMLQQRRIRPAIGLLMPPIVPLISIILSYTISFASRDSRSRIAPFAEWSMLTDNVGFSFLRSWLFPLVVLATCGLVLGWSRSALLLGPAWAIALPALAQSILLAETDANGIVRGFGNFMSGTSTATSALYFMSTIAIIRLPVRFRAPLFALLGVQSIAGLVHLYNWTVTGSYF